MNIQLILYVQMSCFAGLITNSATYNVIWIKLVKSRSWTGAPKKDTIE